MPPSTKKVEAVIKLDSSEAKNKTALAISAGSANRPSGTCTSRRWARSGSVANSSCSKGVLTGPGHSALTLTPSRANWTPNSRDIDSTPPFDAEYIYATYVLERAEELGALVVNKPRALRDAIFARSAAITIPSEASRQAQPERWRAKMHALPNAIDFERLSQDAASRQPEKLILSVGRLMAEKDYPTLIRAFAQVADEFPEWQLRIAGDGHLRPAIEAEIAHSGYADRITLPGYVRDIPAEYRRAAIFAIPSLYESFGLVTAEALATGCPAVGFADCIGTAQLIENEVNGLLVEPGEDRVSALADALRRLMAEAHLREQLGAAGPASVEHYSLHSIADRWEEMLTQVCQGENK